jgi:uncharacterized protein YndB with AHSA1/START domain
LPEAVFLVDIDEHRSEIHRALTTRDGLAAWWTSDVEMGSDVGDTISLGFPDAPKRFALRIVEVAQDQIKWTSVGEFPPHWEDTEISFTISSGGEGGGSPVFFEHKGFATADPMLGHTAYVWAGLLSSLKQYCETGRGNPIG